MMTGIRIGNRNDTRKAKNGRGMKSPIIRRFSPRRISTNLVFATLGVLYLVLLSTNRLLFADAFASNLVETAIGCMTDLSTDEVIMNEEVKPPEESDFPKMHLAVLDETNKPIEATTFSYDPTTKTFQIAFVNPYPTSEFNDDLQFVMEIEGPSKAAEFVSGGSIGCEDKKRVSNRLLDSQASVVLQINDPTAKLRIWGGWATGHNAVRLVPDLVLEPGEAAPEELEEQIEELDEEIAEEEFRNTDEEKKLREEGEEKLERLLNNEDANSQEELEEQIEELEEEIAEEEFRNTDEEKKLREEGEEKLERLLNDEGASGNSQTQEERAVSKKATKEEKHQRKRKNLLEKADNLPEGLNDLSKRNKDLGIEIAHKSRERGDASKPKTLSLKTKQLDLESFNSKKNTDREKKRHRLTDHTADHRKRRDSPENLGLYDDKTDDDLPAMGEPEAVNDDVLPEIDDDGDEGTQAQKPKASPLKEEERELDHFLACAFFAASMALFLTVFGKKREKGRRDL